jgi:hypothetical protein
MASNVIEVIAKGKDLVSGPMSKMAKGVTGSLVSITKSVFSLRGAFATLAGTAGAGVLIKSFIDASSKMEDFRTRLISLTKSEELAEEKLKALSDFAARAPFELPAIIEAGVTLEAFGAKAEQTIEPLGDLAAFMGVDIQEASSAFGRAFAAGAGAADVLRERGVLTLIKLQTGIEDLTKLTLPEFREAMLQAMTDPDGKIFGATARLAETFTGQVSMMSDAIFQLQTTVGDALLPVMKDLITNHIVPVIKRVREWAKVNQELIGQKFEGFVETLLRAFSFLVRGIAAVIDKSNIFLGVFKSISAAGSAVVSSITKMAEAFTRLQIVAEVFEAIGKSGAELESAALQIFKLQRRADKLGTSAGELAENTLTKFGEALVLIQQKGGDTSSQIQQLIKDFEDLGQKSKEDFVGPPRPPTPAARAGGIDVGAPQLTKQETAEIDKLIKKSLELNQLKSDLFAADVERLASRLEITEATEQQILEFAQAADAIKNELLDAEALKAAELRAQFLEGTEEGHIAELELIELQNEQKLALAEQFGVSKEAVETSIAKKAEARERKQLLKNLNTAAKFASLTQQLAINTNQIIVESGEEKNKALFAIEKAAAIVSAIINTAVGVTQALELPFPLSFIVAGLTAAVGATQIGLIAATAFAEGGIVGRATLGLVGEEGPEAIIPLDSPAAASLGIGTSAGNGEFRGGPPIVIENIEMFPNITEGDTLLEIPETTLERWARTSLIPVLDSLNERSLRAETT